MSTLGIIAIVIGCIIGAPFIIAALAIIGDLICVIINLVIEVVEGILL